MKPKEAYSRKEVYDILTSLCLFSGANNEQGLKEVKGITYGEKADTILNVWDSLNEKQSMVTAVSKYKTGV